jgi:hypothetical protein
VRSGALSEGRRSTVDTDGTGHVYEKRKVAAEEEWKKE